MKIAQVRDIVGHEMFDKHASILTADCFHDDWPDVRNWPGYDLPQTTSIEDL